MRDIIRIFESPQKKDVFKLFIEKYSQTWLENSPIQDKEKIKVFLDFLLTCYSKPENINLLCPYKKKKQRNMYRITEYDIPNEILLSKK